MDMKSFKDWLWAIRRPGHHLLQYHVNQPPKHLQHAQAIRKCPVLAHGSDMYVHNLLPNAPKSAPHPPERTSHLNHGNGSMRKLWHSSSLVHMYLVRRSRCSAQLVHATTAALTSSPASLGAAKNDRYIPFVCCAGTRTVWREEGYDAHTISLRVW